MKIYQKKKGEAVSRATDSLEAGKITEDVLLDRFPEDSKTRKLAEIFLEGIHEMRDIEELQEQHKPYKVEELSKLAGDLAARFDWDAFLEHYDFDPFDSSRERDDWDNGFMSNALSTFATVREIQQQVNGKTLSQEPYAQLEYNQRNLQSAAKAWQKRGFLSESPQTNAEAPTLEETKQRRLALRERLVQGEKAIRDYASLKGRFRSLTSSYRFKDNLFEEVVNSLDVERGYGYAGDTWQQHEYDPKYLDAIERFVSRRIKRYIEDNTLPVFGEEYKAYVEKLRNIDAETALSHLTINGFEERWGETLVVTEENP